MATLAEQWQAQGYAKGSHEGIEKGMERGMEKGMEKGIKKSAHRIAKNLLVQGLVLKNIAQVTELPVAEVLAIQEEMTAVD